MRDVSPRVSRNAARDLLQRFRIPADALRRPVSTFSVGRKRRRRQKGESKGQAAKGTAC
jgi:hypothetical protein